ncbi:MAG TPA: FAD-dependent oxidoreductase [Hyphomicrobiaceae bacterium]|nr:FAD-dependent oxidoreductase [Hyphomicrobiaceae bacterium]
MTRSTHPLSVTVAGAGIAGLWQALTLARAGHRVRLIEESAEPFAAAASAYAGAMLAPFCEDEGAEPVVRDLGIAAMAVWQDTYPGTIAHGSLVVAAPRDRAEIARFARMTHGHEAVAAERIGALEPDLGGRFDAGLFYAGEAHVAPLAAMTFLLEEARRVGVEARFGTPWRPRPAGDNEYIIDCRGLAARDALPDLRGVRGERLVVRARDIALTRPVRLLHPRHPLYVVPWGEHRFMLGATVIESDDARPITVRSALELLGMAYALHPAFGEAEILDAGAGVRPAFADNVPHIVVEGRTLHVNGMFRHGFLLAPVLARLVADYLADGAMDDRVFRVRSTG